LFVLGVQFQPLSAQGSNQTKWTAAGNLLAARVCYTATLLTNGRVLLVGGYGGSGELASTELFDPTSGVFTHSADLSQGDDKAARGHLHHLHSNHNGLRCCTFSRMACFRANSALVQISSGLLL